MTDTRVTWGLAALVAFEGILAAYTFGNGAIPFTLMALAAGALLAWTLWRHALGDAPSPIVLALVAGVMLVRAVWQTSANMPLGLMATYVVPLGFAMLAVAAARPHERARLALAGIGLVALARAWFVLYYFGLSNTTLAVANLVAAVGASAWATGALRADEGDAADAREGAAPPS